MKKILIVDDEPNILFSISTLLKKEGYVVACAENGEIALEEYRTFKPDVVLLDVMMPIMDGLETAKNIRALDQDSKTRIIFLTAKGTSQDKQLGYISGGDEYLIKPFSNERLLEKICEKAM